MGGCHVFIPCEVGQDVFMLLLDLSFNLTEAWWNRKRLWPAKCIGMWIYLYIHNTILHRHIYIYIISFIYIYIHIFKWSEVGGAETSDVHITSCLEMRDWTPPHENGHETVSNLDLGYTIFRQAPCIINYIVYFPRISMTMTNIYL